MKLFRYFGYALCALCIAGAWSCDNDDDCDEKYEELKSQVDDLVSRVSKLESWCVTTNEQISSLQSIVDVLNSNDYVTSVEELADGSGYVLHFSQSSPVIIKHGTNGFDGTNGVDGVDGVNGLTPIIGVAKDSDGNYYWTVKYGDAEAQWLLDSEGNQIRANGLDGANGKDGQDGKDGVDGKDGKDGQDGVNGTDGKDGADGKDGVNGTDGKDGKDGVDGKDGKDGVDGTDGADGHTPVLSVDTYTDGNLYWKVDGEWLLYQGAKVQASVSSYAKPVFSDIVVDNDNNEVVLTLSASGDTIVLPIKLATAFAFDMNESNIIDPLGSTYTLIFPNTVNADNYDGILIEVADSYYNKTNYVEDNYNNDYWYINYQKPVFDENGELASNPSVNLTPTSNSHYNDKVVLRVTLIMKDGTSETISRILINKGGAINEYTLSDNTILICERKDWETYKNYDCNTGSLSTILNDLIGYDKITIVGDLNKEDYLCLNDYKNSLNNLVIHATNIQYLDLSSSQSLTNVEVESRDDSSLKDYVFKDCSALTEATINVNIGNYTFENCVNLTSVFQNADREFKLNEVEGTYKNCKSLKHASVRSSVGKETYYGCTGLTNIWVSSSEGEKVVIGESAFKECSGLTTLSIPANTQIGESAFENCISLQELDVSYDNIEFGAYAFRGCPGIVTLKTGNYAVFDDYAFASDDHVYSLTTGEYCAIGESAFEGASNLNSIFILSATNIGKSAFASSSIKKAEIEYVTNVEVSAFDSCKNLESIEVRSPMDFANIFTNSPNVLYAALGECTIDKSIATLFPKLKGLTLIGNNVIKEEAFKNFSTPLSLGSYYINTFEKSAFEGCTFESFDYLAEQEIGEAAFKDCVFQQYVSLTRCNLSKYAFAGSQFWRNVYLEDCKIGDDAFSGTTINRCEIQNGSLGNSVFANASLNELELWNDPTIEANTFDEFNTTSCELYIGGSQYTEWNGLTWYGYGMSNSDTEGAAGK